MKFRLIYKPRTYLLGDTDCLRGFTTIGKIITPAVKTHIGATIMSIDSRDINLFSNYLTNSSNNFFSHAYLSLISQYLHNFIHCKAKTNKRLNIRSFVDLYPI